MDHTSRRIIQSGPAPRGPYSTAIEAAGLVHVAGLTAREDGTPMPARDAGEQTRRTLERIARALKDAGTSLDRAVSVMVYLRSAADFKEMNAAYAPFWPSEPPARTTVVAALPDPEALVEITVVAAAAGADRTVIHPSGWQPSPNPYSYAVRTGDTVFLSGLVSRNGRDNTVAGGDVREQTRVVMANAGEILGAAGLGFEHVVAAKIFLPDASTFEAMNAVYRESFPGTKPARATVHAALAGPAYSVEITLVASAATAVPIESGGTPNPNLSAAIGTSSHVYLSGLLGVVPGNESDVGAQTEETLRRAVRWLEAAGCSKSDVVESLVYLTDMSAYGPMNDAYRRFFGDRFPARTTVGTGLFLPTGLVEIMLTAVRGQP